jgi:hypothetical protein
MKHGTHSLGLRFRNARLLKYRAFEFGKSSRRLKFRAYLIIEHKQYAFLRLFHYLCLIVVTVKCNHFSTRWTSISPVFLRRAAVRISAVQPFPCFQKSAALLLQSTRLYVPPVIQTITGDNLPDFENARRIPMGIPPALLTWLLQLPPPVL